MCAVWQTPLFHNSIRTAWHVYKSKESVSVARLGLMLTWSNPPRTPTSSVQEREQERLVKLLTSRGQRESTSPLKHG